MVDGQRALKRLPANRIWVAVVVVCIAALALALYGRHPASITDYELFFREWVSALSGWAALLAAFSTISAINRQIAQADRHQAQNVILQLRPQFITAEQVVKDCTKVETYLQRCGSYLKGFNAYLPNHPGRRGLQDILDELDKLEEFLISFNLEKFREFRPAFSTMHEIDAKKAVIEAKVQLNSIIPTLPEHPRGDEPTPLSEHANERLERTLRLTTRYVQMTKSDAESFLQQRQRPEWAGRV